MWQLTQAVSLVQYWWRATTPQGIHSPYLFELLNMIHDQSRQYYCFDALESLRQQLLQTHEVIPPADFGAGSKKGHVKTVSEVMKTAASSPEKCRVLFRMVQRLKPRTLLELGTSCGLMSGYLASADQQSKLYTLEGNPALVKIAKELASVMKLTNIEFVTGKFEDTLSSVLDKVPTFDFIYLDGDHRGEAVVKNCNLIIPRLSESAVIVIDDIRWSGDMLDAWRLVKSHHAVNAALDYFSFGILFCRPDFLDEVDMQIIPQRIPPKWILK